MGGRKAAMLAPPLASRAYRTANGQVTIWPSARKSYCRCDTPTSDVLMLSLWFLADRARRAARRAGCVAPP
eukprot:COSAG06_NODE_54225_length_295_cov_1.836735_1_plen_70_part_10